MTVLGEHLYVTGWMVECNLTPQEVEAILMHLVEQINMDTGGMPAKVWQFPLSDGRGGAGVTAVQPLVESFSLGLRPAGSVIGDTWVDQSHTFFVISSCKPYDIRIVEEWLTGFVGRIIECGEFHLGELK